ncbi:MAG TPA: hypothetical protein VF189_00215 [Patescibacteria group bacterium]
MFGKLTDFAYRRSVKESIGFYLAYFVLIVIAAVAIAGFLSIISGNSSNNFGVSTGTIVAIISCVTLSILISLRKKRLNKFSYILLIFISGVLATWGGALLGLIPVAYLTTRK